MTPSAEEAIHMRDQKNKPMFITGLQYGNDCLFDVCAGRAVAQLVWVLGSRVGHNVNQPPRSLVESHISLLHSR